MVEKREKCTFLESCPFFKTLAMPTSAEALKSLYCKGDYKGCTRYLLKSSGKSIPEGMWPDGTVPN